MKNTPLTAAEVLAKPALLTCRIKRVEIRLSAYPDLTYRYQASLIQHDRVEGPAVILDSTLNMTVNTAMDSFWAFVRDEFFTQYDEAAEEWALRNGNEIQISCGALPPR